ncbi:IQ motif [Trypanosoma melophagium]|uniref:IQ motif n=1 Tax=Trypanosoma melophagium TaxID=715481 RepID=UPI003519FB56|nr:IQ motif [Trypanosoma melophagium]
MLSIDLTDIIPRTSQGIPVMLERRELGTECNGKNGKTKSTGSKLRQRLLASGLETNGIVREGRNHYISKLNEKNKFSSSYTSPSSKSASTTSLLRLVLHILGRVSENPSDNITAPRPPQGPPRNNGRHRQVHSNILSGGTKAQILSKDEKYNGRSNTIQTRRGLSTADLVRSAANEVHPYYFISSSENVEKTFSPLNHVSVVPYIGLNDSLGEKVFHSRVPSDSSSLFRSAPAAAAVAAASDLKVPKEVLRESLSQGICEESLVGLLLDACTDEDGNVALGDVLPFLASNEDNRGDSVPLNNKLSMTNSEATLKAYFRVFILIGARQYPVDDKLRTTTIPQTILKRTTSTTRTRKRTPMGERTREKEENTSVKADSPWLLLAEQLFQHLSRFPRQLLYTTGPLGEERTPPVEWADRWDSWSTSPSALRELPILQIWPLIMFPRFVVLMTRWGQRPIDVLRELQITCASSQNGSILSLGTTTTTTTIGGSLLTDGSHGYSVSSQHPYYEEDGNILVKQTGNGNTSSDISNDSNNERNDLVNSDTTRVRVRVKTRDSVQRINCLLNTWENESLNDAVKSHYQPSHHSSKKSSLPSQRQNNTPMTKNMRFNGKTTFVQPPNKKISRYYDDGKTDKPRTIARAWDEEFGPYAGSTFRASAYPFNLADETATTVEKREERRSRSNGKVKNQSYHKKEKSCFFAARLHSAVKSGHQISNNSVENLPLNKEESEPLRVVSSHVRPDSRLSFFSSFQVFPSTTELSDLACDVLKRAHGERQLTEVRTLENGHQQEKEQQQEEQGEQQEQEQEQEQEHEQQMMKHKRERKEKQHYNHNQQRSSGIEVFSPPSSLPINNGVFVNRHDSEGSTAVKQVIEIPSANTVVGLPKGMMYEAIQQPLLESEDKYCTSNSANSMIAFKKKQEDNIPCTLTTETIRSPCNVDIAISLQESNNRVPGETPLGVISSALHPPISVESAVRNNDIGDQECKLSAPALPINCNNTLLPMEVDKSASADEVLVSMRRAAAEVIYSRWMGYKARRSLSSQRNLQRCSFLHCSTAFEPPPLPHYSGEYGNCCTPVNSTNSETATFRELTVSLLGQVSSRNTSASVKQRERVRFLNIVLLLQRVGHGYLSRKCFKVNLIKDAMKPPAISDNSFLSDQLKETPPLLNTNTCLNGVSNAFPTKTTPMDTSTATPSNNNVSVSLSTLTTTNSTTTPNVNPTSRQRLSGVTFVTYGEDVHREAKSEWREVSSESSVRYRSTPPDFWHGRITRQVDWQKQRQSQQQQQQQDQQEKKKEEVKECSSKPTEHLIRKRIKTPIGSPMNNESGFDTLESELPIQQEKVMTPQTSFLLAMSTEESREAHFSDSVTPSEMLLTNTEMDGSNFTNSPSGTQNSNYLFSAVPSCCFSNCSTFSVHSTSSCTQDFKELDDPFPFEKDEEEDDDDMKNFSDSLSLSSEEFQNDKGVSATMDYIVPTGLTDQPAMGESEALLLIQRVGRGFADRRQIHFSLLVNVSTFEICVIRRTAAGYYDRKQLGYRYHAVLEAERELQWFHRRNRSAMQIQRMIRGFLARQRTKKIQRKLWVRIELHIAREQHEIYEEF